MEEIKTIVKGTTAKLSHICAGKVYYQIETEEHLYQLELDSLSDDWKTTFLLPYFMAIRLMRWIRKGIEAKDSTFIMLK